jgi:hypothetical protein
VGRWFGLITDKMIRRRTFHSVGELEPRHLRVARKLERQAQGVRLAGTADVILDKVRRCKEAIVKT